MTTYQRLKEKLDADIAAEQKTIDILARIRKAVARFDGKQNNKRLLTAIRAEFGEGVLVSSSYGSGYTIWGTPLGLDYDHRLLFFLSSPTFSLDFFDRDNACHGEAAVQRNVKRAAIHDSQLAVLAYNIDSIVESAERLKKGTPEVLQSFVRDLIKEGAL